jgi:hypothetical protein
MSKTLSVVLVGALLLATSSCSVINKFTGDPNLKKTADLWSDVPKMEGLASSEAEMPVYVKILMRTALNNLYRLNNANEDRTPATGDWAVFTTTKSPDDVKNFYTNARMTSFGSWDASKDSTCSSGNQTGFSGVGCVFAKTVNKRDIGLLIVAAQDEQKKQTNVFFVRVEKDETPPSNKPAKK